MYTNVCLLKTSNKNSLSFIEVSHYDSGTHVRRISAPWTGTHRLRAEPDQHRPDTLSSSVWRVAQVRNNSYFILSCILLKLTWPHLQPRTTPPVSQGLPERTGEDLVALEHLSMVYKWSHLDRWVNVCVCPLNWLLLFLHVGTYKYYNLPLIHKFEKMYYTLRDKWESPQMDTNLFLKYS